MARSAELAEFLRAVESGDVVRVRALAGARPALLSSNDPDSFGATPLIHAAGTGNRAMVDALLELGADIDQKSDWWAGGFSPLDGVSDEMAEHLLARGARLTPHAAAARGKIDALRRMIDADRAIVHARGGDGQTPLHYARTVEIADLLLSRGAGIDTSDIDHASTPAQWLGDSRPEVVAHLVKRGAQADPFMAVRIGEGALLERLLAREPDGVRVRITRERFPAAPPAAGHIYLYTIGEGCTLMHCAASVGRAEMVRMLVRKGADVMARGGYDDQTPLHAAAWHDRSEAALALVDAGAEIGAKSGKLHQNDPLGWAIVSGAAKTVKTLIGRGAEVKEHHREDAEKGVRGDFRCLNRKRAVREWEEVRGIVMG